MSNQSEFMQTNAGAAIVGVVVGFALAVMQSWLQSRAAAIRAVRLCALELVTYMVAMKEWMVSKPPTRPLQIPEHKAFGVAASGLASAPVVHTNIIIMAYRDLEVLQRSWTNDRMRDTAALMLWMDEYGDGITKALDWADGWPKSWWHAIVRRYQAWWPGGNRPG